MILKDNRGGTLVIVLFLVAILGVLGTTVMTIGVTETNQVNIQEKKTQAYYAARSGAHAVAAAIAADPESNDPKTLGNSTNNITIPGSEADIVAISVSENPADSGRFIVTSTGRAEYKTGSIDQTVSIEMLDSSGIFDYAIFGYESVDLGNNTNVHGDVGTNDSGMDFGNNNTIVHGEVSYFPDQPGDPIVHNGNGSYDNQPNANTLDEPVEPLDIDYTKWDGIGNTTISGNNDITISDIIVLVEGNLSVGGSAEVLFDAGMPTHVWIKGNMTFSGNSEILADSLTPVYFYVDGDTITFNGTPNMKGMIYAPNATVNWNGGGTGNFDGAIITKDFNGPNSGAGGNLYYNDKLNIEDLALMNKYRINRWLD